MAFGIKRSELNYWKERVASGNIAIITHYWLDSRFPQSKTVTKIGCVDISKLQTWGKKYHLRPEWIHHRDSYPHFDVFGQRQLDILLQEECIDQLRRFRLSDY